MHPLDGIEIKMDRSWEHITGLQAEITPFVRDNPVQFRWEETEKELGGQVLRGKTVYASWPPVPDRFGAIIGDALTNMRAALDHLACELVIANQQTPPWNNQFPTVSEPPAPDKPLRLLPLISAQAGRIVADVQPYQNIAKGRLAEVHPLHVLKHLVNRDKHRTLTVTEMFAADAVIKVTGLGGAPIFGQLDAPQGIYPEEIGWLPEEMFPTAERWKVFTTLDPILSLDVGHGQLESIIDLLRRMHRYVLDDVIVPLAACF